MTGRHTEKEKQRLMHARKGIETTTEGVIVMDKHVDRQLDR